MWEIMQQKRPSLRKLGSSRNVLSAEDAALALALRGVSVHWLKTSLMFEVHEAGFDKSATIYTLENLHGDDLGIIRKKGANVACPRDGRLGAAYVDCLDGEDNVGKSDMMLSYTWGNSIGSIVNTLMDYCISNTLNPKRTYVWICAFCNNQHRIAGGDGIEVPLEEFQRTFSERMNGIGHVVAMMSPWYEPLNLSRVWCLFELYAAHQNEDCELTIAMPPEGKQKMVDALNNREIAHLNNLFDILANNKVKNAVASEESDRIRILTMVENGKGCPSAAGPGDSFKRLDDTVNALLRDWVKHGIMQVVLEQEADAKDFQDSAKCGMLCTYTGKVMAKNGEREQATTLYKKAVVIHERIYGKMHPYTVASYSQLGLMQKEQGHYDEALETFKTVLSIHETTLGEHHLNTAISYNNIGLMLYQKEDYDGALERYNKVLEVYVKELGSNHSNVAAVHGNIGYAQMQKGYYNKALRHFKKTLEIRLNFYGKEEHPEGHPEVADAYMNIGSALKAKGDNYIDEALENFEKALAIEETFMGSAHASTHDSIGFALLAKKDYAGARFHHEKALNMYEHVYGSKHELVAKSHSNIGLALYPTGDLEGALFHHEQALAIRERVLGSDHRFTSATLSHITRIQMDMSL